MKLIQFKTASAQRVYEDYLTRSEKMLHILSEEDRNDCLLELNSYIYEYLDAHQENDELKNVLNVTERLGPPEQTLKEIIAAKKVRQAVKTLNPKHVIIALGLNLRNGLIYIILSVLFLVGLCFPVLIVFKIIYPELVGLHIGGNSFYIGTTSDQATTKEILGNLFIPVMILATASIYAVIILLLKIPKSKKIQRC